MLTNKLEILAELLAATVHLHPHYGNDLQTLIANELEELPDDEADRFPLVSNLS